MAIVIEIYKWGANVFRTAANFMTYDEPHPDLLAYRFCATEGEAVGIYRRGAAEFSEYGPAGYRAFRQFERFLQVHGIVPKPDGSGPRGRRDNRYKRKL